MSKSTNLGEESRRLLKNVLELNEVGALLLDAAVVVVHLFQLSLDLAELLL